MYYGSIRRRKERGMSRKLTEKVIAKKNLKFNERHKSTNSRLSKNSK
jgi:hypothetical protein